MKEEQLDKKEMDSQVSKCICTPYLRPHKYCEKCQTVVINFLNKHGLGTLEQDIKVEKLNKEISNLNGVINHLNKKLISKDNELNKLRKEETKKC